MQALYLVEHRVHRFLIPNEARERYLRKRALHYLVQPHDHRPDAAIALMHARIEHPRVASAMGAQNVLVEHLDEIAVGQIIRGDDRDAGVLRQPTRVLDHHAVQLAERSFGEPIEAASRVAAESRD